MTTKSTKDEINLFLDRGRDDGRRTRLRPVGHQARRVADRGLDAESIDFLDMVFRLERAFKIKIPREDHRQRARSLTEAEFEQKVC